MNLPQDDQQTANLFWQDEILQVMYWMLGEGVADQVTIDDLRRFLDAPDETLAAAMAQLCATNLARLTKPGFYQLTEMGVVEGRRRFVDEFEGMLKQGHYECNDPDCDCHNPAATEPCKALLHQH